MVCSKFASKFIIINSNDAFRERLFHINIIPIALYFSVTVAYQKSENDRNFVIEIYNRYRALRAVVFTIQVSSLDVKFPLIVKFTVRMFTFITHFENKILQQNIVYVINSCRLCGVVDITSQAVRHAFLLALPLPRLRVAP